MNGIGANIHVPSSFLLLKLVRAVVSEKNLSMKSAYDSAVQAPVAVLGRPLRVDSSVTMDRYAALCLSLSRSNFRKDIVAKTSPSALIIIPQPMNLSPCSCMIFVHLGVELLGEGTDSQAP